MEHASSTHAAHAHPTVGLYFAVFGALAVLTAITVVVARMDLGVLNNVVALGIAGIKTTLVVLFFMHVHYASRLTKVFAAAGFFWLSILISFTVSDMDVRKPGMDSRGWAPMPETLPLPVPPGVTLHQESGSPLAGSPQEKPSH
jgi:cytochrome c oxidase subunit 4